MRYKGRASFEMKRVMKKLGGAVRRRVNTNRPLTRIRSYAAVIASRRDGLKWWYVQTRWGRGEDSQ